MARPTTYTFLPGFAPKGANPSDIQAALRKQAAAREAAQAEYDKTLQAWRDAVANRERLLHEANQHVKKARDDFTAAKVRARELKLPGVR